jgi:hypothetical protein
MSQAPRQKKQRTTKKKTQLATVPDAALTNVRGANTDIGVTYFYNGRWWYRDPYGN